MNKKIILRLLLIATVSLFFLNSCRTDETMQEEKRTEREKIEAFVKFENNLTTQKNNSEYISYHKPFKEIIQAFLNKNPAFAQKFQNEVGDIYFDLRSLTYGETSKVIAYPIMKDDKVNAFLIGSINQQRDWVNFTVAKDNTPEVQRIISKFQNYYNSASVASRGGREEEQPIEEIVIIVEIGSPGGGNSGVTFPYVDHNGFGSGMSGGGPSFGGGGASGPQVPLVQSPCEKTKSLLQDQKIKNITDDLKNHMATGKGEKGWRDNKTGNPTQTTQNGQHSVNFGDSSTMNGGYHNHTGTKVDIFSATDIANLIEVARYQSIGNTGNAYMGLIGPNDVHYVIYFNGNHNDIPPNTYTSEEKENWELEQMLQTFALIKKPEFKEIINGKATLNSKGLEQIFFNTVSKMGLYNKISLQKIENNQSLTITLNTDGSTSKVPCN